MTQLIQLIQDLPREIKEMTFPEILRNSRDKIGLMQYRVAEHVGMLPSRLKNLESGWFKTMPPAKELRSICEFYGLPLDEIRKKAETFIKSREVRKLY